MNDASSDAPPDASRDAPPGDAPNDAPPGDAPNDAPLGDAQAPSGPCALGDLPSGAMIVDLTNVSSAAIATAITNAGTYLRMNPNETYVIRLPAGTVDLSAQAQGNATFDVSSIQPSQGRLIITGAGHTNTTLILADHFAATFGNNSSHVCFVGMHFTKPDYTVSQGIVVSTAGTDIVLDIQTGFPSPADLHSDMGKGYLLRQYTNSPTDPQLLGQFDAGADQQIGWSNPTQLSGSQWQLTTKQMPVWSAGDLIGIKAEPGQVADAGITDEAGAGRFVGGSDIVFNDILWTFDAHIQFDGSSSVQFWNSRIERPAPLAGQAACLATPGGGPQFHNSQMVAGANTGHVISNFFADSTGDDSIAFFDGAQGVVQNSVLRNAFSKRCVNSEASPNVTVDAFTRANAENCMIVFQ